MQQSFEPLASLSHATSKQVVAFVGSALSFPKHLLDLLSQQIEDVNFLRLSDIAHVSHNLKLHKQMPLVLIDEAALPEDPCAVIGDLVLSGASHIAIAYRSGTRIAGLLARGAELPGRCDVSALPLDSQLEVFTSIVKIMLCGQRFVHCDLQHVESAAIPAEPVAAPAQPPARSAELTERELQVLALVAEGKQNKIVAHQLELSEHTVKLHLHHVLNKLGLTNRTEASAWYHAQTAWEKGDGTA